MYYESFTIEYTFMYRLYRHNVVMANRAVKHQPTTAVIINGILTSFVTLSFSTRYK